MSGFYLYKRKHEQPEFFRRGKKFATTTEPAPLTLLCIKVFWLRDKYPPEIYALLATKSATFNKNIHIGVQLHQMHRDLVQREPEARWSMAEIWDMDVNGVSWESEVV